jgi:hypothetical protein
LNLKTPVPNCIPRALQCTCFHHQLENPEMKNQRGAISGGLIALIVVGLLALLLIPMYISAMNYGARTEITLDTKLQDNENIYGQGTQAIMEIAQVPQMYKNDLLEIVKADIQGRYGSDGSKATFQWFNERQLPIDASMYKAIQQQILAFRGKFEVSQRELLDQRNTYQIALNTFPRSVFLSMAGYPKVDLKKYDIVTTNKARQTFETKRDDGIQLPGLRPAN